MWFLVNDGQLEGQRNVDGEEENFNRNKSYDQNGPEHITCPVYMFRPLYNVFIYTLYACVRVCIIYVYFILYMYISLSPIMYG